jgi:hypothetical protein
MIFHILFWKKNTVKVKEEPIDKNLQSIFDDLDAMLISSPELNSGKPYLRLNKPNEIKKLETKTRLVKFEPTLETIKEEINENDVPDLELLEFEDIPLNKKRKFEEFETDFIQL